MGIVVLRSTTPCVAVSSRSSSNLLTVISMVVVDTAGATSTGILGLPTLLLFSSYIKYKSNKTSSNRRRVGEVEKRSRCLRCSGFAVEPSCGESLPAIADAIVIRGRCSGFYPVSHSFHKHSTSRGEEERPASWKRGRIPAFMRLIARLVY